MTVTLKRVAARKGVQGHIKVTGLVCQTHYDRVSIVNTISGEWALKFSTVGVSGRNEYQEIMTKSLISALSEFGIFLRSIEKFSDIPVGCFISQ